jgi:hypothetical protein
MLTWVLSLTDLWSGPRAYLDKARCISGLDLGCDVLLG